MARVTSPLPPYLASPFDDVAFLAGAFFLAGPGLALCPFFAASKYDIFFAGAGAGLPTGFFAGAGLPTGLGLGAGAGLPTGFFAGAFVGFFGVAAGFFFPFSDVGTGPLGIGVPLRSHSLQ